MPFVSTCWVCCDALIKFNSFAWQVIYGETNSAKSFPRDLKWTRFEDMPQTFAFDKQWKVICKSIKEIFDKSFR